MFPYYEKLARISIATLATLAVPVGATSINDGSDGERISLQAYPNPASGDAHFWMIANEHDRYSITLLDAVGKELVTMHEGTLSAGKHAFRVPLSAYPAGSYFINVRNSRGVASLRVIRIP